MAGRERRFSGCIVSECAATRPPTCGHCTNRLEARRFITLEIRVITTEEQALQPLCVPEYIRRNAFAFHFKEVFGAREKLPYFARQK
jgi:hypothetical protein